MCLEHPLNQRDNDVLFADTNACRIQSSPKDSVFRTDLA